MARKESNVTRIVRLTSERFPSLTDAGISAEELVRFVLTKRNQLARLSWVKIGDDNRDYMNTAVFLLPLSDKALKEIENLGRGDIQRHLREKTYPFSRLDTKTRERLLHLPNSWVHGAADSLLAGRKRRRVPADVRRILAEYKKDK